MIKILVVAANIEDFKRYVLSLIGDLDFAYKTGTVLTKELTFQMITALDIDQARELDDTWRVVFITFWAEKITEDERLRVQNALFRFRRLSP